MDEDVSLDVERLGDAGPEPTRPAALAADARRQAVPSLRGYVYQIARTVLAWLDLPDDEVIYVEGAEDFDQVSGSDVIANQVKAVQANLTLRSPDVADTLRNLWDTARRNPGRKFEVRFLTTAQPGVEADNPFDGPGVAFWNAARVEADTTLRLCRSEKLRTFFARRDTLTDEVADFISASDAEQFFSTFIARLRFDTALDDIVGVEQAIRDRLVTLGERLGVPPTAAEEALDSLLSTVLRIATSPNDRVLDRSLLLTEFEKRTQVTVPRAEFVPRSEFEASFDRMQRDILKVSSTTTVRNVASRVLVAAPPLPPRYLSRVTPLALERLSRDGVLIVVGPFQVGKTLFAIESGLRQGGSWLYLDLSLGSGVDAVAAMRQATAEIAELPDLGGVIVDDLPAVVAPAAKMGSAFAELRDVASSRGGAIIVTARKSLPDTFLVNARLADAESVVLETLNSQEIRSFLEERGCPPEHLDRWTRIVDATTGGQPLLVRARVSVIEDEHFEGPTLAELLTLPPVVSEAKRDVRLTVAETLPEAAFELLTRLSIAAHPVRRELALRFANAEPAIRWPGNELDRLTAGWLDDLGDGRIRINTLLLDMGTDVHGNDWTGRMHSVLARLMLDEQELSSVDAAHILHHGMIAEDDAVLQRVLGAMFSAESSTWEPFADVAEALPAMWVGEATRPTRLSAQTMSLFRLAQLRVSLIRRGRVFTELMRAFNDEFPPGSTDAGVRTTRFLGISEILMRGRNATNIADLVGLAAEWAELATELAPPDMWADSAGEPEHDLLAAVGFMMLGSILTPERLQTFLDALNTRDVEFQGRMLSFVSLDRTYAHGFVQQIWLPLVRDDRNDWLAPLAAMRRGFAFTSALGLDILADVFAEAVVRVIADFGDGPQAALREADGFLAERGERVMLDLRAARAQCLFMLDGAEAALAVWREVLPAREWDGVELTPLLDYRRAAIAEVKLGDWFAAGGWLDAASVHLSAETNGLWKMASAFDASYALWRGDGRDASLRALRGALALLAAIVVDPDDSRQFAVLKRIGHTVMCMASLGHPGQGFENPPVAMASNLETEFPPGSAILPPTPVDVIIAQALRFEYLIGGDGSLANLYERRVLHSGSSVARSYGSWSAVFRATSAGATKGIIALIADADSATADVSEGQGNVVTRPFFANGIRIAFLISCLVPGLRGSIDAECVDAWRAEASALGLADVLGGMLDSVAALFVTGSMPAAVVTTGVDGDLELQFLASIAHASTAVLSAATWVQINAVWATLLLACPWRDLAGALLVRLIEDRWRKSTTNRFQLVAPNVTVPALEAALASDGTPWRRTTRILFSAEAATGTRLHAELRAQLESAE